MAYIDRDLLIEKIGSTKIDSIIPNWSKPEIKDTICKQGQAIKKIIETQPIADVVEVVRCEKCKYGRYDLLDKDIRCEKHCLYTQPNDFCSYGERKEVD